MICDPRIILGGEGGGFGPPQISDPRTTYCTKDVFPSIGRTQNKKPDAIGVNPWGVYAVHGCHELAVIKLFLNNFFITSHELRRQIEGAATYPTPTTLMVPNNAVHDLAIVVANKAVSIAINHAFPQSKFGHVTWEFKRRGLVGPRCTNGIPTV